MFLFFRFWCLFRILFVRLVLSLYVYFFQKLNHLLIVFKSFAVRINILLKLRRSLLHLRRWGWYLLFGRGCRWDESLLLLLLVSLLKLLLLWPIVSCCGSLVYLLLWSLIEKFNSGNRLSSFIILNLRMLNQFYYLWLLFFWLKCIHAKLLLGPRVINTCKGELIDILI